LYQGVPESLASSSWWKALSTGADGKPLIL
jgi:hypothetical protein